MTGRTRRPTVPGSWLLELARAMVDEPALSTLITPVLADLQQEVREAGPSRSRRAAARLRGYVAFWKLLLAAPFAQPSSPMGAPVTTAVIGRSGGNLLVVLAAGLVAAIWPWFGWFAVATLAAGVLMAVALHGWYTRHPGDRLSGLAWLPALALVVAAWPMFGWFVGMVVVAGAALAVVLRRWNTSHPSTQASTTRCSDRPGAEINMSSIPVAGDIGGLLFVVGGVLIVLLGLPDIRWFVMGSVVAGVLTAGGLHAWRSWHPSHGSAPESIFRR